MADIPYRNRSLRQLTLMVVVAAQFCGIGLLAGGVAALIVGDNAALGGLLIASGFFLSLGALMAYVLVSVLLKAEENINRLNMNLLDSIEIIRRMEPRVASIEENSQISDIALSITHREREREALRQAIREEMYSGDWEAVNHLIDEMERRFGYREEAASLRKELGQIREMTIEEKIGEALRHIDHLMDEHRWERARQESERLMRLFPRHARVMDLPSELNRRRAAHKQELMQKWRAAVARDAIDEGIELLTELDQYLSPEEAKELQESARHVFKARLLNLGVQFSLAVQEARWRDALEVGLLLRKEFPNSRMANEVSEKIDTLRVRAGFTTDAEVTQRTPPPPPATPAT